jgi:mannose/fructose-specific phosphotransferase system component IIA
MTGLVITTHARLGEELLHASEMIIGPAEKAMFVQMTVSRAFENGLKKPFRRPAGSFWPDFAVSSGMLLLTR